ncbi:MAG: O-antigen ligase family protein [Candidatus Eremiobacteraeota bacterium]|nr:O-antigen ligase family protein [Candidatus Eremiobacteraeota bacterium]
MPAALGAIFAIVPLFPSFIALTAVGFPGLSLVPRPMMFVTLAFCGLLAIYAIATLARWSLQAQPLLLPLLAVFSAGVTAGVAGFNPIAGAVFTGIGGLGIVWHCSVMRFYADRYAATTIYASFLTSGILAAAAAVAMVVSRFPAAQYTLQHGRATGTFILPGELAGFLIVLIPMAYALARIARPRSLRALGWTACAVGLIALGMTYSRAGWMGFAAAIAFLCAVRTRRTGLAALVVLAGIAAVLLLFNAHHDPSEDYTRLSIWQAAVQIADRFPLTGVGPFNFSRLYEVVRAPDGDATAFHAHSLYLTFLVEFGILGSAAVVWTMWRFAAELRRRLANAAAPEAFLSLAITAGLVGVAVQGLIDTVTVVIFGLWMPIMALALATAAGGDRSPAIDA